ncbi:MAG: GFA family protein [Rhodospirillales bacterium]|nr:GFA family protein [Rhodospirillales bacterium]
MKYQGSCHCGDVAFEVEGEVQGLMDCNCSICVRKASLLWFVPRQALRLLTSETNLSCYKFGKEVISHRFCKRCGIHPFGEGIGPDGQPMAAINVRCLEGFDFTKLPVTHFDGRAL